MTVIVKVLPEHQLVVGEFRDELRREDMRRFMETLDQSPEVKSNFNMLAILPDGLKFSLTADEFRAFGRREPQLSPKSRRAIVASDQLTYGFSRMYTSVANQIIDRFTIFTDLESACEYLDITVSDLDLDS